MASDNSSSVAQRLQKFGHAKMFLLYSEKHGKLSECLLACLLFKQNSNIIVINVVHFFWVHSFWIHDGIVRPGYLWGHEVSSA